jgi:hypothetical protein
VACPKRLGGVCTSAEDVLSRAGFSPLLYTAAGDVRLLRRSLCRRYHGPAAGDRAHRLKEATGFASWTQYGALPCAPFVAFRYAVYCTGHCSNGLAGP